MGAMKPGPFHRLLDDARDRGIDPFEAGEFGPDNMEEIERLKRRIAVRTARTESSEPESEAKKTQTVVVRIVEWAEWIPAPTMADLAPSTDPRTGEKVMQKKPMHTGITSFETLPHENVLEVSIFGTGYSKVIELDEDDEDGDPKVMGFGRYVFQAVLAHNLAEDNRASFDDVMAKQRAPLELEAKRRAEQGRDRREDLVVIEGDRATEVVKNPEQAIARGAKRSTARSTRKKK
jgi:hypothetical protein